MCADFERFVSYPPFDIFRRDAPGWDGFSEFRVAVSGIPLHILAPDVGWRGSGEDSSFLATTLPHGAFFSKTAEALRGNASSSWRSVYSVLSSLPRVFHRRRTAGGAYDVRCGYRDLFFREMAKTHFHGRWNADDKHWITSPPARGLSVALGTALDSFSRSRRRFFPGSLPPATAPVELARYQKRAFGKIRDAGAGGKRAFLVAHDMGLGKTYTSLACGSGFIDANGGGAGCFALVPSSTLGQWVRSGEAFGMNVRVMHSFDPKWKDADETDFKAADLVLSTPEFLVGNPERMALAVRVASGGLLILDEATKFKNTTSGNYKAASLLSLASAFVVFLSGTPILRDIGEMENMILLGDPTYYPLAEFLANHAKTESKDVYIPSKKKTVTVEKTTYFGEEEFRRRVLPFFDRELKNSTTEVMLPELRVETVDVVAGETEKTVVRIIGEEHERFYRESLDEKTALEHLAAGHVSKGGASMAYSQMALDDPTSVLLVESESPVLAATRKRVVSERIIPEGYVCAKTKALFAILDSTECHESPSVVFTFFSTVAERLRIVLAERFPDREIFSSDGSATPRRRAATLGKLKTTRNGILVCTDSMTYGVEMQFASTLVHYDLPWSPMIADQRSDRINRIGAGGVKRVFFLVADVRLERAKWSLHEERRMVAKTVLDPSRATVPSSCTTNGKTKNQSDFKSAKKENSQLALFF